MAVKFLTGIDLFGTLDLNQFELQNAVVQNLAAAPTSPAPIAGQIYYDTVLDKLRIYNGAAWLTMPDGTGANDFLDGLSFNTGTGVLTASVSNQADVTVDLDGRYALTSSIPTVNNGVLTMTTSTGLDGGSSTFSANQAGNSTFAVSLNFNELPVGGTLVGTDQLISLNGAVESRQLISDIPLSIFDNDAGFITSASLPTVSNATITLAAGTGLATGGAFTLNQAANETITFDLATAGAGAATYGSASDSIKIDTLTLDAYGRVTAVTTGNTGQVNTVVSGDTNTLSHSGTINKTLTPVTAAIANGGTALATGDQIFDFVTGQIANIPSGLSFEGNWNASTDTPDLSTATPDNGQFWIVSVAGSTDLDGITDWKVGDWAIYVSTGAGTDGWQKVDNTSTLSGSGVAGQVSFWTGTANVAGDAGFTYNATTNNLAVGNNITAGGIMTASGGNSTEWNTGYDNSITALNVTGTTTKTLTATQQDGGTLTATWTDIDTNTQRAAGTGLSLSGNTLNVNVDGTQTVAANTSSTTAGKTYKVQVDSSDNLVVNVPWANTQTVSSVAASTANNLKGISVNPTSGNVLVGLDINGLTEVQALALTDTIPVYDAGTNKKVSVDNINAATTATGTITAGQLSGTVTHNFGVNTIVQTIDSNGTTVYCDITRTATTAVASIGTTQAGAITILVQKIG
jgi:hypothetical protein